MIDNEKKLANDLLMWGTCITTKNGTRVEPFSEEWDNAIKNKTEMTTREKEIGQILTHLENNTVSLEEATNALEFYYQDYEIKTV